jgi:hypothetical protein
MFFANVLCNINYTDCWEFGVSGEETVPSKKSVGGAYGMYERERFLVQKPEGKTALST